MRYICLDTETTGVSFRAGHKILEIGCIEIIDGKKGKTYQQFLNPQRKIDDGAIKIHGITDERIKNEPIFANIANDFLEFITDGVLVIHNASFDVTFLNGELAHAGMPPLTNHVIDTLILARRKFPGQPASLDALCKRFSVESSHRVMHGALLDATLLADVFVHLGSGESEENNIHALDIENNKFKRKVYNIQTREFLPSPDERAVHNEIIKKIAQ